MTSVIIGIVCWSAAFVTGGATNAAALSYDSMYPTENTTWGCVNGTISVAADTCKTDNSDVTVFLQASLTSAAKTTIKERLTNQYAATDLSVTVQTAGVYSGSSETDIVYLQSASGMPGTLAGIAWCNDAVSTTRCDQAYVQFRYDTFSSELACHETGHAVGLTHGVNAYPRQSNTSSALGCMETPVSGSRSGLGANNIYQINSTY